MYDEQNTAYLNIRLWLEQTLSHIATGNAKNAHDKITTALHHLPIIKPTRATPDAVEKVTIEQFKEYMLECCCDGYEEDAECLMKRFPNGLKIIGNEGG